MLAPIPVLPVENFCCLRIPVFAPIVPVFQDFINPVFRRDILSSQITIGCASSRLHDFSFLHIHKRVLETGQSNYLGAQVPVPSTLSTVYWRVCLQGYHDSVICDYLEFGWPVGYVQVNN